MLELEVRHCELISCSHKRGAKPCPLCDVLFQWPGQAAVSYRTPYLTHHLQKWNIRFQQLELFALIMLIFAAVIFGSNFSPDTYIK
jgi:hypothetical protein